jgi:hypothetical protein
LAGCVAVELGQLAALLAFEVGIRELEGLVARQLESLHGLLL